SCLFCLLFLNAASPTEFSPLSLHDALPIYRPCAERPVTGHRRAHQPRHRRRHAAARRASAPAAGRRAGPDGEGGWRGERFFGRRDRKSTRLNSSHVKISYAVFCLKKKKANE